MFLEHFEASEFPPPPLMSAQAQDPCLLCPRLCTPPCDYAGAESLPDVMGASTGLLAPLLRIAFSTSLPALGADLGVHAAHAAHAVNGGVGQVGTGGGGGQVTLSLAAAELQANVSTESVIVCSRILCQVCMGALLHGHMRV